MLFLIVLGAGVLILGIAYIVNIIQTKHHAQGEANWLRVDGQITGTSVYCHTRRLPDRTETTHTPVVTYSYTIDGMTYTSDKRDFFAYTRHSMPDRDDAEQFIADYHSGDTVEVRFNPANPAQSALITQKPVAHNAVVWYGVMSVTMGSLIIALGVWLTIR